jgi:hypothetical protein
MNPRKHYTEKQLEASAILDAVRNGNKYIQARRINWALRTLGEPLE